MDEENRKKLDEYEDETSKLSMADLLDRLVLLRISDKEEGENVTENAMHSLRIDIVKREINRRLGLSKDDPDAEAGSSTGPVKTLGSFID